MRTNEGQRRDRVTFVLIAREDVRTRSTGRTGAGVAAGRRAAIPRRA